MRQRRALIGFLAAPIAPAMVFALGATIFGVVGAMLEYPLYSYLFVSLIWFLYAIVVAYPATLILGVPSYFIYKKYGFLSLKSYIVGGITLGAISPFLLFPIFGILEVLDFDFWVFLTGSIFGVITSTVFWYVSVKSSNKYSQQDKPTLRSGLPLL